MADRFYGYQYGTNPRKLNSEYAPYRNRYPKKEVPVKNIDKKTIKANSRTDRVQSEIHKKNILNHRKKQVTSSNNIVQNNLQDDIQANENNVNYGVQNVKITKVNIKTKLKIVMSIIAGFSVLFAISYQNSLINESFNRKEQYKKEMEALSKTNQQIEVSIDNNLNLNNIEQAAKDKLGMQKLSNEQKIYVSLPKEDYVAPATEQIVIEEDLSFFEKIIRWFTK